MRLHLFSTLFAFFMWSCTETPKDLAKFSFEDITSSANVVDNESDIFDISVINLEFNKNSLIDYPLKVVFAGEYIFILSARSDVKQYSNDGKFIRRVSAAGKAINEYTFVSDIATGPNPNRIYLSDVGGKLLEYDLDGNFIDHHTLGMGMKTLLCRPNGDIYVSTQVIIGNEPLILQNMNINGEVVSSIENQFKYQYIPEIGIGAYVDSKSLFDLNGEVVYHQQTRDTVFTYDGDTLTPRYIYEFKRDIDSDPVRYFKDRDNVELLYDFSEDDKYTYPTFALKGWKLATYMIDKSSGKVAEMDIKIDNSDTRFIPRWCYGNNLVDFIEGDENSNMKIVILTHKQQ